MKPRRPRYSATRKAAVAGGFRSGLEAGIAKDLNDKGIKYEYEQSTVSYIKPIRSGLCTSCDGTNVGKRCRYTPDFKLVASGIFVESKGRLTASDRTKLAAIKLQHPTLDLRLLLAADNWCTKLHKQRYSEWAESKGFVWAVGKVIPASWLSRAAGAA